jgi:copper transport protein
LALAVLLPKSTPVHLNKQEQKTVYWETIARFSKLASICVIVILGTGIYSSVLHIPSFDTLFNTTYGWMLLAKGALMLVMLALGFNGLLRGKKQDRKLGRGVWIEFYTGVIVLILAAMLANLPTAAADPGDALLKGTADGGYNISVAISPNKVGQNHFKLELNAPDGTPLQNIEQITLSLTSKESDLGVTKLTFPGNGPYEADELIPQGGRWNVSVHVLLKSLDAIDLDLPLTVGK